MHTIYHGFRCMSFMNPHVMQLGLAEACHAIFYPPQGIFTTTFTLDTASTQLHTMHLGQRCKMGIQHTILIMLVQFLPLILVYCWLWPAPNSNIAWMGPLAPACMVHVSAFPPPKVASLTWHLYAPTQLAFLASTKHLTGTTAPKTASLRGLLSYLGNQ
jgi:hypothetical protein